MSVGDLAALLVGGVLAGAVNAVAGGGSLVTLPLLVLVGLPAPVANGTNRVAVVLQSLASAAAFRRAGLGDRGRVARLLLPTVAGAVAGAWASTLVGDAGLRRLIAWVALLMLGAILLRPERRVGRRSGSPACARWAAPPAFFAVGLYGGFLQAGVGVWLLVALVGLEGMGLVAANAVKVLLVAGFTLPALAVFQFRGLVAWGPGLVLATGTVVGGWLGAHLAVRWGAPLVRAVLAVVVLLMALRLLAGG